MGAAALLRRWLSAAARWPDKPSQSVDQRRSTRSGATRPSPQLARWRLGLPRRISVPAGHNVPKSSPGRWTRSIAGRHPGGGLIWRTSGVTLHGLELPFGARALASSAVVLERQSGFAGLCSCWASVDPHALLRPAPGSRAGRKGASAIDPVPAPLLLLVTLPRRAPRRVVSPSPMVRPQRVKLSPDRSSRHHCNLERSHQPSVPPQSQRGIGSEAGTSLGSDHRWLSSAVAQVNQAMSSKRNAGSFGIPTSSRAATKAATARPSICSCGPLPLCMRTTSAWPPTTSV